MDKWSSVQARFSGAWIPVKLQLRSLLSTKNAGHQTNLTRNASLC